jgi:hypothetical protein
MPHTTLCTHVQSTDNHFKRTGPSPPRQPRLKSRLHTTNAIHTLSPPIGNLLEAIAGNTMAVPILFAQTFADPSLGPWPDLDGECF